MGWIKCIDCENLQHDFVAQTFALIAPFELILHRVSCSNEMVSNAPKHYETHQNMSLGPDGVDRVDLLQKIPMRHRGKNFCSSSARCTPSFVRQPNGPECTQIVRNAPKCQFRVQWGGSDAFVAKNSDKDFVAQTFALVRHVLHRVS